MNEIYCQKPRCSWRWATRFSSQKKRLRAAIDRTERILATWRFAVRTEGVLWIQPTHHSLSVQELNEFLVLVQLAFPPDGLREIEFDFSYVEWIGPHWTVVLALLIKFARRFDARCRVIRLHGQPAAVVSLYWRDPELMGLIDRPAERRMSLPSLQTAHTPASRDPR